ncbi:MAG: FlgD immunoglobulin-like domain containing protein, partial [candidate division WOR-3 bacterium]
YCTITRNEVYGLRLENCNPFLIGGNNLTANKVYGIFAVNCGLNLTGNYIEQTSGYGIYLRGRSSCNFYDDPMPKCNLITGLDWPDNYGLYCYGSGIGAINDYGHSYIEHFGQAGICCMKFASPTIRDFWHIRENYIGLYCVNGSRPVIRGQILPNHNRSFFQLNVHAVWAEGNSLPDLGVYPDSPGYNSIIDSYIYHVFYDDSPGLPLMAEMNWWGSDPPDPEKFVGNVEYDPWLTGSGGGGGQSVLISEFVRTKFYKGHPNPFKTRITFRYDLGKKSKVAIKIYNSLGRLVKNLDLSGKEKGHYQVTWNGLDENGLPVPSGVYFGTLETETLHQTQKIVLTR